MPEVNSALGESTLRILAFRICHCIGVKIDLNYPQRGRVARPPSLLALATSQSVQLRKRRRLGRVYLVQAIHAIRL